MSTISSTKSVIAARADPPGIADYVALLKPRVMSLVVFTGFVGLYLAPGHHDPLLSAVAMLCIAAGAGACGAINMWYDRDIDAVMRRTRGRPLPAGRMPPGRAFCFGCVLAGASIGVMGQAVNWAAAGLLAITIGFYVFVYTAWLKRRTPQNIVIGGAAGAFPPMIGWTAATGHVGVPSLVLFALIFVWTPPHFWALALYRSRDYAAAGLPMLPVVAGRRETKRQMLIYTLLLWPISLAPAFMGVAGFVYAAGAAALNLLLTLAAVRVWFDEGDVAAKRMFGFSILYLFLMFALLMLDRTPGAAGLPG